MSEPKIDPEQVSNPAPGWKNCPNILFEYQDWNLGNGVSVRLLRDKMKRLGFKTFQHDNYELRLTTPAFDDRTHYCIPDGVFHAFLRSAGRKIEEPDA